MNIRINFKSLSLTLWSSAVATFYNPHALQHVANISGQRKQKHVTSKKIKRYQKVSKYDAWYKCVQIMVQRYPFLDRWCTLYIVFVPPGHVSPPSGAGSANGEFARQ